MTPAFSPGPWITHGAWVGSVRRWIFEDLYEQCSFHMAEKMPSSVKVGVRPISLRMRSYSSPLRPWAATSSGVMLVCFAAFSLVFGLVLGLVFGLAFDLVLSLAFGLTFGRVFGSVFRLVSGFLATTDRAFALRAIGVDLSVRFRDV